MPGEEPALFYTGLVARLYAPLRGRAPDPGPCARFVERHGEPALELGCGDGDPLLELRRRGLDVEGLDASADMLARCRARAEAEGLDVVLHEARFESMALGRRYRSIFLAGPTFNLLPDDDLAAAALARIAEHLDDGGAALVPLHVPPPVPEAVLGRPRTTTEPDGTVLSFSIVDAERDEAARRQACLLRYEAVGEVVEREWVLHWFDRSTFAAMAAGAGLRVDQILDDTGAEWSTVLRAP